MSPDNQNKTKRIAVVAVHGIAYHAPDSSAKLIANLLLGMRRLPSNSAAGNTDGGAVYTPFRESRLDMETRHLNYRERGQEVRTKKLGPGGYAPRIRQRLKGRSSEETLDHDFMCDLLDGYTASGSDSVYQTLRLEGSRLDEKGKPTADVHVYEMYWNDLSKVGSGLAGFFSTLYLLIFHVGDLGTVTVNMARTENQGEKDSNAGRYLWWLFAALQSLAVFLFVVPIPLLNLLLLAAGMGILPCWLSDLKDPQGLQTPAGRIIACALPAVLALVIGLGISWRFYKSAAGKPVRSWPGLPAYLAFLLTAMAVTLSAWLPWTLVSDTNVCNVLELEWLAVAALLYGVILRSFKAYRLNVDWIGWGIGALLAAVITGLYFTRPMDGTNTSQAIATYLFEAIRYCYTGLFASWGAFLIGIVLVLLVGLVTILGFSRNADYRARNLRSLWTSVISLTIPPLLFLGVTLSLWSAVQYATNSIWREYDAAPPAYSLKAGPGQWALDRAKQATKEAIEEEEAKAQKQATLRDKEPRAVKPFTVRGDLYLKSLVAEAPAWLPLQLALAALALLISVWALTPSVGAELSPNRGKAVTEKTDNVPSNEEKKAKPFPLKDFSVPLGRWLTSGYLLMGVSGGLFLIICILYFWFCFHPGDFQGLFPALISNVDKLDKQDVRGKTAIGVTAATTLLASVNALMKQIQGTVGKAGLLVGVLLDVDNHLRQFPTGKTPRARMAARYASLLRYLFLWREESDPDPTKPGYDAIFIVAHSQGTILTADFLRFLEDERKADASTGTTDFQTMEETLANPNAPIYLFTMGCPLRQLYGLRFPYLYEWARDDNNRHKPDPNDLGVRLWLNNYMTGDYVGRELWKTDTDPTVWDFEEKPPKSPMDLHGQSPLHLDWCMGAGAHNHYWDNTVPEFVRCLDEWIGSIEKKPNP